MSTPTYEPSLESAFRSNYTASGFPPTKTLAKSFAKYLEQCRRGLFAEVFAGATSPSDRRVLQWIFFNP
jgi:hypothetical protein